MPGWHCPSAPTQPSHGIAASCRGGGAASTIGKASGVEIPPSGMEALASSVTSVASTSNGPKSGFRWVPSGRWAKPSVVGTVPSPTGTPPSVLGRASPGGRVPSGWPVPPVPPVAASPRAVPPPMPPPPSVSLDAVTLLSMQPVRATPSARAPRAACKRRFLVFWVVMVPLGVVRVVQVNRPQAITFRANAQSCSGRRKSARDAVYRPFPLADCQARLTLRVGETPPMRRSRASRPHLILVRSRPPKLAKLGGIT